MAADLDRIRAAYDAVAERYAETYLHELDHKPLDVVLLEWFADEVRGRGPVADLGTGPGHIARFLHERGVDAFGIDLSPRTVALARERHRDRGLDLRVGDFFALDLPDASLAGATAFYAHVHVHAEALPRAFRELARVLRPGAPALLAFHVAEGMLHQDEWMGARVNAEWHFWPMTTLVAALEEAGLVADVKIERTPYVPHEHPTPRGYVLARRPVAAASSAGSE
jgi:SAM-dependent methyltransferase